MGMQLRGDGMRKRVLVLGFVVAILYGSFRLGNDVVLNPQFYLAILVGMIPVAICTWIIIRSPQTDRFFLSRVFAAALGARYCLAYIVYSRGLQQFLGADADTYDAFGNALLKSWQGLVDPNSYWLARYTSTKTAG